MTKPIPIMIKVWAGSQSHDFRYIRRSLPSLLASDLPAGARVVIVDDQSTDRRIAPLLERLATSDSRVELWRNPENLGPNRGQAYNFPRLVDRYPDAEVYVTCDDDIVYHPGWLQRVLQVRAEARTRGIDGVLTAMNSPGRPAYGSLDLPTSTVLLKERQMALNWVIPREIYQQVGPFRDVGVAFDTDYCARMIELKIPVICLKPSWIQNIGYFGAYQHGDHLKAPDFVGSRDAYLLSRDALFTVRNAAAALADRCIASPPGQVLRPFVKRLLKRS